MQTKKFKTKNKRMHKYINSMAKRLSRSPLSKIRRRRIMSGKITHKGSRINLRNHTITPTKYLPYHREINRNSSKSSLNSARVSRRKYRPKYKRRNHKPQPKSDVSSAQEYGDLIST